MYRSRAPPGAPLESRGCQFLGGLRTVILIIRGERKIVLLTTIRVSGLIWETQPVENSPFGAIKDPPPLGVTDLACACEWVNPALQP